jgi:hypothetical protein
MAATLLELRDKAKALLNNDDFFTDSNLDIHINASYHFHHAITSDALQNRLAIIDFIDVVAGQTDYDVSTVKNSDRLPDQVIDVKYKASNIAAVSYLDMSYVTSFKTDDRTGRGIPSDYSIIGNNIVTSIPPNKSLVDGLKVTFVPYPLNLVNDTDEVDVAFTGLGEQCIAYYAVLMAKSQEEIWDEGSSALSGFKSTYEDLVLRFKNNLEMRAFEEDEVRTYLNDDVNY